MTPFEMMYMQKFEDEQSKNPQRVHYGFGELLCPKCHNKLVQEELNTLECFSCGQKIIYDLGD